MGYVLGGIVEFFVRAMVLSAKAYRARSWPELSAEVMSASFKPHQGTCKIAEVYYKYYLDGICYADVYKEPFLWQDSGDSYARQLEPRSEIKVRVKPGKPSVSVPCIRTS
jgi:hypothetical protein